ncbi:hypothetical protein NKH10_20970, partial [Mesorhizobium sp. M1340]
DAAKVPISHRIKKCAWNDDYLINAITHAAGGGITGTAGIGLELTARNFAQAPKSDTLAD